MREYQAFIAGCWSMALWWVPQPNYFGMWMEDATRSNVLPPITGF